MNNSSEKPKSINPWQHHEIPILAVILAFFVGVSLSLPFKLIEEKEDKPFLLGPRRELINQVLALTEEKDSLKNALVTEREQMGLLEDSLGKKEAESEILLERFHNASLLAGTRGVNGKGIILRLDESDDEITYPGEISSNLIHHEDLLNITNELWAAGAEAMAIRSGETIERIVATSAIRCAGPVVHVNNQPMVPPFEFLAIGDPKTLHNALIGEGRVLQVIDFYRIEYTIEEIDNLFIPPYSGAIKNRFTLPVDESQLEGDNS